MKSFLVREEDRNWLWFTLIICLGFVLRIAAMVGLDHVPESDELAYRSMAVNLINGQGIVDNMGNRAMYNVGYPLFVLAPVFLIFGESLTAARLFNMLLGGATIALCYAVAKEAGAGRLGRLLAAAIWAVYLPASVYGVYLAKENLMAPLMLAAMWFALRLMKEPATRLAIGSGILFGLLALVGNAALCLAAVAMFSLAVTTESPLRKVKLALVMLLWALALASPWMIRNMQILGAPVLNTNGGFNLYTGNNPAATGWFISISDTPRGPTWEELRKVGEVHASETLKHEAIEWATEHPAEFLTLALRKAAYFWKPPFHEGKGPGSTAEKIFRALWAIQFLVLVTAAICSLLIGKLRNRQLAVLWLAVGSYTAVHMIFYVLFRYREPIMPFIGIMAALAIESFLLKTVLFQEPRLSGTR